MTTPSMPALRLLAVAGALLLPITAFASLPTGDRAIHRVAADVPAFPVIGSGGSDARRIAGACRTASADDVAAGLCSTVRIADRGSRA